MRKQPRRLEPLLEICKKKPIRIWQKLINLMNDTKIAEEIIIIRERENPRIHTRMDIYLGIRKEEKALKRGHALLMHMLTWKYIMIISHSTHKSINMNIRQKPPKNTQA